MRVPKKYSSHFILALTGLLFCFFLAGLQSVASAEKSTDTLAIIKLRKRPARDILPQVHTALSPAGRASADTIINAVIVSDTPESIENIRRLVARLDVPAARVTMQLRFRQATSQTRSLSTTGAVNNGEGGLRISSGTFNRNKTMQLVVSSGSSGYLLVGRDIPFTEFWLDLCSRYGYRFKWMTRYKRIESGFEVRPVVFGSRVELTLLPRISFGDQREIRFTEAATRITIPVNTWVGVAAADTGSDSVAAAILTAGGEKNSRAMVLEIRARVGT